MAKLRLAGFDGVVPRASATSLAENQAQQADNVRLYSGELRPWRGARREFVPGISGVLSIYRMIDAAGDSRWLTWSSEVDVTPGPSADLVDIRVYYTGDGTPKKTNKDLAFAGDGPYPADYLEMGVPAPASAPTVSAVAGSAPATETRAYVYTYISEFGSLDEESAPSPPSALVTISQNQAAQVGGFAAPPAGKYNITKIRIYRTISGAQTGANYAFVAEIPVSQPSYTDDLKAEQLGEGLPTIGWTPPPANLAGIVSMAGGMLAGFVGNTVYFSEPFFPHAWPTRYALTVPYRIVGLGAVGSLLVVMTDRYPFIITGTTPGALSMERVPLPEPCVSKRSIAVDERGVIYASPNGLVVIGPEGWGLATQALFRRDEWQAHSPATLVGAVFDNHYFGFFRSPTLGNRAMVLTRTDIPALCYFNAESLAVHVDDRQARLFYVGLGDDVIYEADADPINPFGYEWRSKRFVLPRSVPFSAVQVDADYGAQENIDAYNARVAEIISQNQTLWASGASLLGAVNERPLNTRVLNGSILADIPPPASALTVQIIVFGEGQRQVAQRTLGSLGPVRLPPFRTREIEVKIVGNTAVRSVTLATTVAELRE